MKAVLVLAIVIACACAPQNLVRTFVAAPAGTETCTPGDQDAYVYRPARLQTVAACVHVVGTIVSVSTEADGDHHINVRVDDAYRSVLLPGNDFEQGYLIVEPVCQLPPFLADAIRVCADDRDPLGSAPAIGDHVWLEGRYVLDLQHHEWAELHPLYRWGPQP